MKKLNVFLMSMLYKKLILVAKLSGLSESKFIENIEKKIDAAVANALLSTGCDPAPAAMKTRVTTYKTKVAQRNAKEDEVKVMTEHLEIERKEMNDIIVSQWMGIIQTNIAGDTEKAKTMSFEWKGMHGQETPEVNFLNSHPLLLEVKNIGNMMHEITMVNSVTESWHLPPDVGRCVLYETYDIANVRDLKKMIYLGAFKKGKIINHFDPEETHKEVYYVAVYEEKNTGNSGELSGSIKGNII